MRLLIYAFLFVLCFSSVSYASTINHHNGKQPLVPNIEEEEEETTTTSTTYTYAPPVVRNAITSPDESTVWIHGQAGAVVGWRGLDGQYRRIELYKGDQLVEELSGWLEQVDSFIIPCLVKSEWGSGSNFRIRVYDNLENELWSEEFQIQSTVQVTDPGQYVSWSAGMTGATK